MAFVDCSACADRYRRHWIGVVFAILLSPLLWAWAALAALGRLFQPRPRQPRLCLLTGSLPLRRDVARALRRVLAELARFETKVPVELIVVQDRVTRADGEPLRVAVQRTRRGSTALLTIRLAPHARGTCYGWLDALALGDEAAPVVDEVVHLSSVHLAKGKEFRATFTLGLEEGLVPHARAIRSIDAGEAALEEELRVLYVALTRARERLYVSACRERTRGSHMERRRPSRWLSALPPELLAPAAV